jgi:hypothetical protein
LLIYTIYNHSTLFFSVYVFPLVFTICFPATVYNIGTIEVLLHCTLPISMYYSTPSLLILLLAIMLLLPWNFGSQVKSKSRSLCDYRSVSKLVLLSPPIGGPRPDINYRLIVTVLFLLSALSDERTGLFFAYALPEQSFSGSSPLGLATIFYCLKFETSLFVASCCSQGHVEGIRPRLHTGKVNSRILLYALSMDQAQKT